MLIAGGVRVRKRMACREGAYQAYGRGGLLCHEQFAVKTLIDWSEGFKALLGRKGFMPDLLGYKWTLIILIAIFLLYSLAATWNEETDKFTVEM